MNTLKTQSLHMLVGADLSGFTIVEMTEVFEELNIVGLFRDADIALAYADTDPRYQIADVLVLTDGIVGYILTMPYPIKLYEDESAVLAFQKKFALESAVSDSLQ